MSFSNIAQYFIQLEFVETVFVDTPPCMYLGDADFPFQDVSSLP
jgi:hypothetical protein